MCQSGAYNNSANGRTDGSALVLGSKQAMLPVRVLMFRAPSATGNMSAEVQWCPLPGGTACQPIPGDWLVPQLPAAELARRALQQNAAARWGSWLLRDILSVVLQPDAAVVTAQLCHLPTRVCMRATTIDGNGGEATPQVRVGAHPPTHSYSQSFVSFLTLNVSIEYTTHSARGLDLLITPQGPAHEYAVVFASRFAWDRPGLATATDTGLMLQGASLDLVTLVATAPALPPQDVPPIHGPGLDGGLPCTADRECASEHCDGLCRPAPILAHYAVSLAAGAVGLTTNQSANASLMYERTDNH